MRKPTRSKRPNISPIRLRPTPSGLMMERVRSMGMITSGSIAKDREVYWSGPAQAIRTLPEVPVLLGKTLKQAATPAPPPSDAETLAAAAFALGFRVLELEGLVETLLHEVHHRAVDQRQARRVHHHLDAALLENRVPRMNFVSIIHDIRESGTSRLLDADAQADARTPLGQVGSNPVSGRFSQRYRHMPPVTLYRPQRHT